MEKNIKRKKIKYAFCGGKGINPFASLRPGATEKDAYVTVQGKPIKLREDGTFSLRFSLPDSEQVIPVKVISSDGIEERTITPIVTKKTI